MLPPPLGNSGPSCRLALALCPGPRRVIDDGDRARFHIPAAGRPRLLKKGAPATSLRRCRNILVVKLDFIGDWVLTTPFLENLRLNAPEATITALVIDRVFELASACRFVDRVISVCRADGRRLVFGAATPMALASFRDDFSGGAFDLAIVPRFDADFNGALQIAHASRAPRIVGFSEVSTPRKRLINRGDDRFYTEAIVDRRPLVHEAERELALVAALGGSVGPKRTSVDVLPADLARAKQFLDMPSGRKARRFLAVAPFGSEPKKTLPAEILAPVVRRLADRFDCGVVVIGSPGDTAAASAFAHRIGGRARSAAGHLGARETAALLATATAFIGMDSGPAHIAAAMGAPVAVLTCHPEDGRPDHTNAPGRFAPLGAPGKVLVIQPEKATPPCREGCEAEAAHCILAMTADSLSARLEAFVIEAIGRENASVSLSA